MDEWILKWNIICKSGKYCWYRCKFQIKTDLFPPETGNFIQLKKSWKSINQFFSFLKWFARMNDQSLNCEKSSTNSVFFLPSFWKLIIWIWILFFDPRIYFWILVFFLLLLLYSVEFETVSIWIQCWGYRLIFLKIINHLDNHFFVEKNVVSFNNELLNDNEKTKILFNFFV